MFEPRSRLTVNPALGIAEYRQFLEDFMDQRKTRDLKALIAPLKVLTWKCAPKPWALSDFADLLKHILMVEPRGILSHKTLCDAMQEESTQSNKGQVPVFLFVLHTKVTTVIFCT